MRNISLDYRKSYLSFGKQGVIVNEQAFAFKLSYSRVPEATTIGLLVFSLYITYDIVKIGRGVKIYLLR